MLYTNTDGPHEQKQIKESSVRYYIQHTTTEKLEPDAKTHNQAPGQTQGIQSKKGKERIHEIKIMMEKST